MLRSSQNAKAVCLKSRFYQIFLLGYEIWYFLSLVPKIICISSVQDSCLQFVNKSPNSFLTIFQTNVLTLAFAQWQITHFHFHGVLTLGQNFKFDEVRSKSVLIFIFEYFGRVNISTLKFWPVLFKMWVGNTGICQFWFRL